MIVVLTGPIQTGKTTALRRVFANGAIPGAAGVLQPVINGRRHVLSLASGETRPLEAEPGDEVVRVGRFAFSAATFAWARARVDSADSAGSWLVVDEVGPLELRGEGLADAVGPAIARARQPGSPRLLLVVRETLLDRAVADLGLSDADVVRLGDRLPGGPRLHPAQTAL
ncbi:nucleoside-triphosphatase [Rubrivirga sp. S365]|uniref:Nucleoside-triphosphatase n=1 Tax=Rubrivirga litoralis TaxID=3075598 RepID=A0ABU3BTS8_9BACT|nr:MULTISPECIES: nucleoside-triphosphatase [unclassified Rubrivirga]MDT0632645.1 nucleoside-triphosphatase [Rubrivirga sp. F394]MDT7857178.1 nucleoside-triphosphatase [Rubrivirga sp. S365]